MIKGIINAFRLIIFLMFILAFGGGNPKKNYRTVKRNLIFRVLFLPAGYKVGDTGCTKYAEQAPIQGYCYRTSVTTTNNCKGVKRYNCQQHNDQYNF